VPARLDRIIAAAAHYGIGVTKPNRGSHWLAKKPGFRTYPIPAHNGERTETSDVYIRGLCRNFEIDAAEFRERL
jgi:hypothetical protein